MTLYTPVLGELIGRRILDNDCVLGSREYYACAIYTISKVIVGIRDETVTTTTWAERVHVRVCCNLPSPLVSVNVTYSMLPTSYGYINLLDAGTAPYVLYQWTTI